MSIGLLGKKLGMTRVYDEKGKSTPATVIEAGGNRILQTKNAEKDGYTSVQIGFDDQKPQRVTKAQTGHFGKTSSTPKRFIREFRLADGETAPESADVAVTVFETGQFVDVIGQSKGKGFQGTIKKHNFHGQPMTHGSTMHRRNGAIGNRSTPGRVWKNMGMPGHMGDERVTIQGLEVISIDAERNVLVVKGAVPGSIGGDVIVRPSVKA